jgi:phthalate 4,5-cis-dihydrodiol dehydrogenase
VFRQGPHQIDTLRLLGGGKLRSVRGMTGRWLDARPVPGYFTAYMEFEDGTPATIMHNGYGYFVMTSSLYPWAQERRGWNDAERAVKRAGLRAAARDEETEKEAYRIGGSNDPTVNAGKAATVPFPWQPYDLGPVEVACERGMMRPAQWGLEIYGDSGHRTVDLRHLQRPEPDVSGGLSLAILEEFHGAVVLGKPAYHTAEWGRATLEATLAVITSARERREIILERQVEMPASYDAEMKLDFTPSLSA